MNHNHYINRKLSTIKPVAWAVILGLLFVLSCLHNCFQLGTWH